MGNSNPAVKIRTTSIRRFARAAVRAGVCALLLTELTPAFAYSVLTHQAIIDAAWPRITVQLHTRFPAASADDLQKARAFAYGGCIIQDMGYFPFGSKFFSDLLHYVRTGDFVTNEIAEAHDLDEYAFALGSLAHYVADNEGHSVAVNPTVGAEYPNLREEYGPSVTYVENPKAHLRVEFSFDVLQVARGSYAPAQYHDAIGFMVASELVNRAFLKTYGLQTSDVFGDMESSIATYRYAVRSLIPQLTEQAWSSDHDDLVKSAQGITRAKFVYRMSAKSFQQEWKHQYKQPSIMIRFLGWVVQVLPKVGPLKFLAFKQPTAQAQTWFKGSFDATLSRYGGLLGDTGRRDFHLPNTNLDTGAALQPSKYSLADMAFGELAMRLDHAKSGPPDAQMSAAILAYFSNPSLPYANKKKAADWARLEGALGRLRSAVP